MGNNKDTELYTITPMFDVSDKHHGPKTLTGTPAECWAYMASFSNHHLYIGELSCVDYSNEYWILKESHEINLYSIVATYIPTEAMYEEYEEYLTEFAKELENNPDADFDDDLRMMLTDAAALFFVMHPAGGSDWLPEESSPWASRILEWKRRPIPHS